jgi:hypothetical protein
LKSKKKKIRGNQNLRMITTEENKENEDPQDPSRKRNPKLSINTYEKLRSIVQKYYWVCEESKKMPYNCKSRAITKLDGVDIHVYVESEKI